MRGGGPGWKRLREKAIPAVSEDSSVVGPTTQRRTVRAPRHSLNPSFGVPRNPLRFEPIARKSAREDVERDLREGLITEEEAREVFGLV